MREDSPTTGGTPSELSELSAELRELDAQYHIANVFGGYKAILPHLQRRANDTYFLIRLDPIALTVEIDSFTKSQSQEANKRYTEAETAAAGTAEQVVLVSVSNIRDLKRAYPSYFLDTEEFLTDIIEIVAPE